MYIYIYSSIGSFAPFCSLLTGGGIIFIGEVGCRFAPGSGLIAHGLPAAVSEFRDGRVGTFPVGRLRFRTLPVR